MTKMSITRNDVCTVSGVTLRHNHAVRHAFRNPAVGNQNQWTKQFLFFKTVQTTKYFSLATLLQHGLQYFPRIGRAARAHLSFLCVRASSTARALASASPLSTVKPDDTRSTSYPPLGTIASYLYTRIHTYAPHLHHSGVHQRRLLPL